MRLVWTSDPFGCVRKGLGNNFARKCLERWSADVGVDEGNNVTSADQCSSSTDDRKCQSH